jgi:GTP pyrophosphokinase
VEILTNKKQSPKADWLSVVTTDKAKNRIKRYLKDQEMKEAELGSALFYRRLKNWKIAYTDRLLSDILKEYNLSSGIEFYHQIPNLLSN